VHEAVYGGRAPINISELAEAQEAFFKSTIKGVIAIR
jgi:hypothetical protein